jgi:hypothetical protein
LSDARVAMRFKMLENRGKMPLPLIVSEINIKSQLPVIVGVASSHDFYAPLLNRIALVEHIKLTNQMRNPASLRGHRTKT